MSIKHKQLSKNQMCVWDFTISKEHHTFNEVREWCQHNGKKWSFQLEKGEKTEYLHFQGRISFKYKTRTPTKFSGQLNIHFSLTSDENKDNNFYVTKEETRVEGPWTDTDPDDYIPRQFRVKEWYPWQQQIIDNVDAWEPDHINLVYDPKGWAGKSTISGYLGCTNQAVDVESYLAYKPGGISEWCHGFGRKRMYLFDIPRSASHNNALWSAIESLKKGKLTDPRYKSKIIWQDSPNIWIFTNTMPNLNHITIKRWKIWKITPLKVFSAVSIDTCKNIYNQQIKSTNYIFQKTGSAGSNPQIEDKTYDSSWTNSGSDLDQPDQLDQKSYEDFDFE